MNWDGFEAHTGDLALFLCSPFKTSSLNASFVLGTTPNFTGAWLLGGLIRWTNANAVEPGNPALFLGMVRRW